MTFGATGGATIISSSTTSPLTVNIHATGSGVDSLNINDTGLVSGTGKLLKLLNAGLTQFSVDNTGNLSFPKTSGPVLFTASAITSSNDAFELQNTGTCGPGKNILDLVSGTSTEASVDCAGGFYPQAIGQQASGDFAGTCSSSMMHNCTIALSHSYTTPACIATQQGSSPKAIGDYSCSVSGTTLTIAWTTTQSGVTMAGWVFGNPN